MKQTYTTYKNGKRVKKVVAEKRYFLPDDIMELKDIIFDTRKKTLSEENKQKVINIVNTSKQEVEHVDIMNEITREIASCDIPRWNCAVITIVQDNNSILYKLLLDGKIIASQIIPDNREKLTKAQQDIIDIEYAMTEREVYDYFDSIDSYKKSLNQSMNQKVK